MRKKKKRGYNLMKHVGIMVLLLLLCSCSAKDVPYDAEKTAEYINNDERWEQLWNALETETMEGLQPENDEVNKKTSTPKPTEKVEEKPDEADMYVAAMEYIDDAISKSSVSKKYSGYSYKIKNKKIKERNNGLGTVYNVSFIIEFNGVLQKYRVDVEVSPMKDYLMGGYTYYVNDTDVYNSGNTFLD